MSLRLTLVNAFEKSRDGHVGVRLIEVVQPGTVDGPDDRFDTALGTDSQLVRVKEVGLEGLAQDGLGGESVNELADRDGPYSAIGLWRGE